MSAQRAQARALDWEEPAPSLTDLGVLFVREGFISPTALAIAQVEQKVSGKSLYRTLISLGLVQEEHLIQWIAQEFGYSLYAPSTDLPDPSLTSLIPADLAYRHTLVPLVWEKETDTLVVAFRDIFDVRAQDDLRATCPQNVTFKPLIGRERDIIRTLDALYKVPQKEYTKKAEGFIDAVLEEAVKSYASDIHFEPSAGLVRVRLRLEGLLTESHLFHGQQWPAFLARLKILSGMNIAETRLPQTGRFSRSMAGREIDFRSSCHPTSGGENFVIRILDRLHTFFELEELGFEPEHVQALQRQLEKPHGILIVTGPTGSGKTTTLYSMLSYLRSHERNIMTLEDPIEYELHGIRQTQVNPDIGLTFSEGVRSILRQDPDVILIGEIRDEATARMALRASMTGHLVLTTLHTNSALLAINRLIDLGLNAHVLSGNINCILSQRLVRIHTHKKNLHLSSRKPLVEILEVTPHLDQLLVCQVPQIELLEAARAQGYQSMADHARTLLDKGVTTETEVKRVIALNP
jgi:type II secretory ATPase GspE/PulE/Tfp pilus assembly ATPase PilB-like protein